MESENLYLKIYKQKSSSELFEIVEDSNSSNESKFLTINLLIERNESNANILQVKSLIEKDEELRKQEVFSSERYKTIWPRYFALAIDGFIINLPILLIRFITIQPDEILFYSSNYLIAAIPNLYSIFLHGQFGQTIGKMFMKIKIIDKSEEKSISYLQAVKRDIIPLVLVSIYNPIFMSEFMNRHLFFSFIIGGMLMIWSLLEIITMLFNPKKRALHDFIAGTVVIRVKQ